ncbi:hypothetical protein J6590_031910 [Homalodisca vitripennis]|nr:hypothetical protein J6590_031910 [Homalodisca vitripennis]
MERAYGCSSVFMFILMWRETSSYNLLESRDLDVGEFCRDYAVDFCRDYAVDFCRDYSVDFCRDYSVGFCRDYAVDSVSVYCTVLAGEDPLSQSHEKFLEPGSSRHLQVESLEQFWTVDEAVQYLI